MSAEKYTFLVPTKDNDGKPFKQTDWSWLQHRLIEMFGGWTIDGKVNGAWRDAQTGHVYHDKSERYTVVVEPAEAPKLLSFLDEVKEHFKQLSLYVEHPQTEVSFR